MNRRDRARAEVLASAWVLVSCAAFFLSACAAIGPPQDGRPLLDGLKFEGNDSVSGSELESKIITAPSSGIFKKTYRTWDADLFEVDQARILRWYRERGFFVAVIAQVDVEPDGQSDGRDRVRVWVHITEGRRTKVTEVSIEGMAQLSHDELVEIQAKLPLAGGDNFDEELYEKDKTMLVAQLREHGFAAAESSGEVQVSLDTALATVVLTAKTGPRYRFGKVILSGNHAIASEVITKAAAIPTGDTFKQSTLDFAQQRVYNLGVFSGARVGLEPLGDDPVAAIRVDVREAPFQTVRFGIGAELEQNRFELPRLRAEYTNRDFFGAHRLELVQQVGWAFVPSITSPDKTGPVSLTTAQVTLPSLIPPGIDLSLRGEFSREIQFGFNYYETAFRAALQYRVGKQTFVLSMNFVRYFGATLDLDLGTLLNNNGTGAALLSSCIPSCSLAYPEARWTLDLRNDLIEPTKGLFATVAAQRTTPFVSFNYWRIAPEIRGYIPITYLMVLAMRAQWGALILSGDSRVSPFTQRFFAGGQSSNRGFGPLQQGPQVGAQPNTLATTNVGLGQSGYASVALPIGGNGMTLASVELRIHTDFIIKSSSIVPFVDASVVTPSWELPFAETLEYAPGLGLRYLTPFGPIRLDVAFLANPIDQIAVSPSPTVLPTPVSIHCHESRGNCISESRVSYHLSIGEAF